MQATPNPQKQLLLLVNRLGFTTACARRLVRRQSFWLFSLRDRAAFVLNERQSKLALSHIAGTLLLPVVNKPRLNACFACSYKMSRRRKVSFATASTDMELGEDSTAIDCDAEVFGNAFDTSTNHVSPLGITSALPAQPTTPMNAHVRTRSTRIGHKTGYYIKDAVINQSLVTPGKRPAPISATSSEETLLVPNLSHAWLRQASMTSASTNSSLQSLSSLDSPVSPLSPLAPDVSHIPSRCIRRWQSKHDLTALPYYHGMLGLADASRRLMQPGVSVGTFLLHLAPVRENPRCVQLTLSCLSQGQHQDTAVVHVVLLIDAYGVHLDQFKFADVPALVMAARAEPLVEGCFLCGFVPLDWSS
jgi:hypothetical protein